MGTRSARCAVTTAVVAVHQCSSAGASSAHGATGWSSMKGQQPSGGRKSRPMVSMGQGKHGSSSPNPPEQWRTRPLTLLKLAFFRAISRINGAEDKLSTQIREI
jgi:hypothetical protein